MAATVKMCDMSINVAIKVFEMLNPGRVKEKTLKNGVKVIGTDVEPKELVYPEGWYYAKGYFTNKHNTTTGLYEVEVMIKSSNGELWKNLKKYCTID